MSIKLNYEDLLPYYIIETKLNGHTIEKEDIQFDEINNSVVQLDISVKIAINENKKSFFKKIFTILLYYLFSFFYIYYCSAKEFLESNEYLIKLNINDFKVNSDLNILLKMNDSKLVTEITNNNCNIINNLLVTETNQTLYNQRLKVFKKIRLISAILVLSLPTYFLIMSLIHKEYDITLMATALELGLIFLLIILLKKNKYK